MKKSRLIDVGMGEKKRARFPDVLQTGALGPCLGIGILNVRKKVGDLGHFLSRDKDDGEKLLIEVLMDADDPSDIRVAMAGNVPFPLHECADKDEFEERIGTFQQQAKYLLELLLSKGIQLEHIQNYFGSKPGNHSYEITVDTKNSLITVKLEESDEFDDFDE